MKLKLLLPLLAALFVTACSPSTSHVDHRFIMPPELKDCNMYMMRSTAGLTTVYVMRCPETTSTTTVGKNDVHIVTNNI